MGNVQFASLVNKIHKRGDFKLIERSHDVLFVLSHPGFFIDLMPQHMARAQESSEMAEVMRRQRTILCDVHPSVRNNIINLDPLSVNHEVHIVPAVQLKRRNGDVTLCWYAD